MLRVDPFPSVADVRFFGFYPLMLLALLRFPAARRGASDALTLALDAATIGLGGFMIV